MASGHNLLALLSLLELSKFACLISQSKSALYSALMLCSDAETGLSLSKLIGQSRPALLGQGLLWHRLQQQMLQLSKSAGSEGQFSEGTGKVGTVSTSQVSEPGRPLASSETIKEAGNTAKLFLQGELTRIFQTGVSLL